jgi:hypothetical protein
MELLVEYGKKERGVYQMFKYINLLCVYCCVGEEPICPLGLSSGKGGGEEDYKTSS